MSNPYRNQYPDQSTELPGNNPPGYGAPVQETTTTGVKVGITLAIIIALAALTLGTWGFVKSDDDETSSDITAGKNLSKDGKTINLDTDLVDITSLDTISTDTTGGGRGFVVIKSGLCVEGTSGFSNGLNHSLTGRHNGILAGISNSIINGNGVSESSITAGINNIIRADNGTAGRSNVINGGGFNTISSSSFSIINGGQQNNLQNSFFSSIDSSEGCSITGSRDSSIISSKSSRIITLANSVDKTVLAGVSISYATDGVSNSFIGGGMSHIMTLGVCNSFIGGGMSHIMSNGVCNSFIGGGMSHIMSNGVCNSFILGGFFNSMNNNYNSIIGGGTSHTMTNGSADCIMMGGVSNNIDNSFNVFIGGGTSNIVNNSSANSFIAGGINNLISTHTGGFLGGGQLNTIDGQGNRRVCILGGMSNLMTGGTSESVILGGISNTLTNVTGGVILGGAGLSSGLNTTRVLDSCIFAGVSNNPGRAVNILQRGAFPGNIVPSIPATATNQTGTSVSLVIGASGPVGPDNAFTVDNRGNIFLGAPGLIDAPGTGTSPGIWHFAEGQNQYTYKAFTIDHPEDEEKWLVHGCLEGPESGVYYRGKDVAPTKVSLPSYAHKIANNFSVNVTPIGEPRPLGVTEVSEEGEFDVYGEGKFFWHVIGERSEINVEPRKDETTLKSFGPYTWHE